MLYGGPGVSSSTPRTRQTVQVCLAQIMADLVDLCERLARATCQIVFETDDDVTSAGSGVFIGRDRILTAKHVVATKSGRAYPHALTIRGDGFAFHGEATFRAAVLNINFPSLMRPIPIDLAEIKVTTLIEGVEPLALREDVCKRGTEVVMAGFTDEVPFPLDFDEYLEIMNPDMNTAKTSLDKKFRYFLRPLMMKRAIVGAVANIAVDEKNGQKIRGAAYVLDNDLTYGGSGGPVVDMDGRLVGLITRKTTTSAKELRIRTAESSGGPTLERLFSGAGLCLSHHLVTDFLR